MFINLDETAAAYAYSGQKGCILMRHSLPAGRTLGCEARDTWQLRGHVTLLGFITPEPEIQKRLPQIILGNPAKFTRSVLAAMAGSVPGPIRLWRQASAWNSHETMRAVITLLMQLLGPFLQTRRPVLIMDVARCHIHESLFGLCKRLGLRVVFVPAKMTWLLQPLDTHGFAKLKHCIRRRWHAQQLQSASGEVSTQEWLQVLCAAVEEVLSFSSWQKAFLDTGILDHQRRVSFCLLRALSLTEPPNIGSSMLQEGDLRSLLPGRLHWKASWFIPELAKPQPSRPPPTALTWPPTEAAAGPVMDEGPVSSRTRARVRGSSSEALLQEHRMPPIPTGSTATASSTAEGARASSSSGLQPTTVGGRLLPWALRPRQVPRPPGPSRRRGRRPHKTATADTPTGGQSPRSWT